MPAMLDNWIFYAIMSAFFAALTTILAKVGVSGTSSNLATAIRTVVILVLAWSIITANGEIKGLSEVSQKTWIFLILSGFATGLSWIFYFKALQMGQASQVAPIDKSSLALTIILAAIFLGETLTWQTVLGAGLIIAGTLVVLL